MLWLYPVLLAYTLFAASSVIDRFLLAGSLPHVGAYAFTIAVTGISAVFLIPFGFRILPLEMVVLAFVIGIISVAAFMAFYRALKLGHVSRVVPMVGALLPLFTLGFTVLVAPDAFHVTKQFTISMAFLILGTIFLSIQQTRGIWRVSRKELAFALLAATLFAFGMVLTKYLYTKVGFINGIIWTNFGAFLTVPFLLLVPGIRRTVLDRHTWRPRGVFVPLLAGKTLGAVGSLLQQYAVFLVQYSQLALIHALQGVQYALLLVFAALLSKKHPALLKEEFSAHTLPLRIIGVTCIAIGLYYLAVQP